MAPIKITLKISRIFGGLSVRYQLQNNEVIDNLVGFSGDFHAAHGRRVRWPLSQLSGLSMWNRNGMDGGLQLLLLRQRATSHLHRNGLQLNVVNPSALSTCWWSNQNERRMWNLDGHSNFIIFRKICLARGQFPYIWTFSRAAINCFNKARLSLNSIDEVCCAFGINFRDNSGVCCSAMWQRGYSMWVTT